MLNAAAFVGTGDVCLLTLDTLRYDVAQHEWAAGRTPNFASVLPASGWEERHAPGSFTYAAHQAIFAGFFPTPARPGKHPRLFAARFSGSETTTNETAVFDKPNIVSGFVSAGYHSVCIGGVGFFNQRTPLGSVLPDLFQEAHWSESLGVTDPQSAANQFGLAARILAEATMPVFLFVNVSAIHQPNYFYVEGRTREEGDDLASHAAALRAVDRELPSLLSALRKRGKSLCVFCSDHGTAYGEDGYIGHRLAHPVVWSVPYSAFFLEQD